MRDADRSDATRRSPTARDAAAVQRLWGERVLSDGDVGRALAELADEVDRRDEAKRIMTRLVEVWPRDVLREAEAWLEATKERPNRIS